MTERDNGHRPDFQEITLPDSLLTLRVKRLSAFLAKDIRNKIRRALPKPDPPMQEVDYGDGQKKLEPNPTHPEYKAALQDYFVEMGDLFISELVAFGVECDFSKKEVMAFRELCAARGVELPADDLLVYVTRLKPLTQADIRTLQDAILGRIQPTEKATASAVESFPSKV